MNNEAEPPFDQLNAGALQTAIFNCANFSGIASDANGVIQIFDVGGELPDFVAAFSGRRA